MKKCKDKINWIEKILGYKTHRLCELDRKKTMEIWSKVVDDFRRENKDLKYCIDFINSNSFILAHRQYQKDDTKYSVYFCVKCNILINEIEKKYDDLYLGLNDLYLAYQKFKEEKVSSIEKRYLND